MKTEKQPESKSKNDADLADVKALRQEQTGEQQQAEMLEAYRLQ